MRDVDDDLLSIGRFGRLSGLSVGALRHYDELGLLRPAQVDRFTGYRRYRREQLEQARTIARLRDLEMPIDEIRELLATDDPAERRRRIGAHRSRLEARAFRLQLLLHVTGRLSQGKEPIVSDATTITSELDAATHRQLGVDLYNTTWTLLEKADRSAFETDEMIHRAHASRWHWGKVGEDVNLARGEWLCSRVYAVLGRGEPALWHARRCVDIDEAAKGREDWDLPSAYEAMARAVLVTGDREGAREWAAKARETLAAIPDPDDREVIEQDLASLDLDDD
ncbi:MAG TPA: helix-turn-helix domain-containing protein [Candidatus Limnocylindrales bacterium]|jgi:DNA-binding transcriptional MerR regulator|nr:helix-turn-helix domain-containing protein [Candidatus Limnocylindrales bacterium]